MFLGCQGLFKSFDGFPGSLPVPRCRLPLKGPWRFSGATRAFPRVPEVEGFPKLSQELPGILPVPQTFRVF